MKKIAIVGANGFLGTRLVSKLLAENCKVTCIYNVNQNASLKSINQISIVDFLTNDYNFNAIIFAAGSFLNSYNELLLLYNDILFKIVNKYSSISRIVYVSSVNVYGSHANPIRENSSFNNPALYGRAKLSGEFIVASCPSYAIVRLTYLYGPGLKNNSFIPTIIDQAVKKRKIVLYGKGERTQDYLYVDDAADLCSVVLESDQNDIYLGATGISISNFEIAQTICNNLRECTIEFTGSENGLSYIFDPTETFKKTNWSPKISFEEGIRKCLL